MTETPEQIAERMFLCRKDIGGPGAWRYACASENHDHDCEARFRPAVATALQSERDSRDSLQAENVRLREALTELVGMYEAVCTNLGFSVMSKSEIAADLRKARSALTAALSIPHSTVNKDVG